LSACINDFLFYEAKKLGTKAMQEEKSCAPFWILVTDLSPKAGKLGR
jgi:hypothetical protein